MAVSLRTASGGAVSGMEESALRALTKLQQVLPKRLGHRVDALQSHTARVAPYSRGPAVDGALLTLVANAARDRELVRFDYSDRSGQGSERKVEPYRLVNWGRRWYLVAFDPQRDDWRTFRVDRLKETRSTGHRFKLRDLPADDVAAWVASKIRAVQQQAYGKVLVQLPAAGRHRPAGPVARGRWRRAARRRRLPGDDGRADPRRPGVLDRHPRRRLRGRRLARARRGRRAAGRRATPGPPDDDVVLAGGQRAAAGAARAGAARSRPAPSLADVAAAMSGVHAQVLSAAEISAAMRVEGATRDDVRRALWHDRTLVKTFGPRGTVHLLPAADLGRWMAALGAIPWRSPFPDGVRMTDEQTDAVIAAIGEALRGQRADGRRAHRGGRRPRRRVGGRAGDAGLPDAVAALAAGHRPGGVRRRALLRPGPRPQGHLHAPGLPGDRPGRRRTTAVAWAVEQYLRSYGPATPASFAPWFGATPAWAAERMAAHPGLVRVDLDGELAFDLPGASYDAARGRRGRPAAALLRRVRRRQPAAAPAVPGPRSRARAVAVGPGRQLPRAAGGRRGGRRLAPAAFGSQGRGHRRAAAPAVEGRGWPTSTRRSPGWARSSRPRPSLTIGEVSVGPHA